MSEGLPVVVFDFDLTLTRWDTADRFFRWLLKRDLWRLLLMLAAMPVLGPLFLLKATRKWTVRFAVWVATLGVSEKDLARLVTVHVESIFAGSEPVFLQAGLAQLEAHLKAGHRVVVATGCIEPLAQALLRNAGYGQVPLIGSTLQPFLGGMARLRHCFGHNKIPMLAERGFSPPWSIAYTDHHSDLPVLQLSHERYLVNPKPSCVSRIQHSLAGTATVLAWQ